jgi:hypothetical protein
MNSLASSALTITNAVIACSAVAVSSGCAGQGYVGGTAVVAGPTEDDGAVVYVEAPPVADIQDYPMATYGGVDVYFVGGLWYQRGPRGWAYYRQEPRELGRQRQEHVQRDHDQRWAAQPPERRVQDERVARRSPAQQGVTEAQPPDRRAQPEQPRRESAPGLPGPQAQERDRAQAPSPHPQRRTAVKSAAAPQHPPAREPEHR